MSDAPLPVLDPRDATAIAAELARRLPAYVPGAEMGDAGPARAVAEVYGRFVQALAERVNQAPEKNQLAFYDLLGVGLLPAQAARAPMAFSALPNVGDSRVPAGTRIGASVPGRSEPLVFETDEAIALAAARLVDVRTVWPGRDAFADHSAAAAAGTPFTLFEPLQPIAHALYLAHDTLLALAGRSAVEIRVDLATPGDAPLPLAWETWDGEAWRPFRAFASPAIAGAADSVDATDGLTRSGIVRVASDCVTSERTTVNGIEARWLRARLDAPLAAAPSAELPLVDRITLRSVVDRRLPAGACAALAESAGLLPDDAYADQAKLDLTKAIQPLGVRPQAGSAFHVAFEEGFAKPGAEVTLCFRKLLTPEEKADQENADLVLDANVAQGFVVQAARADANALLRLERALRATGFGITPAQTAQLDARRKAVEDARDALTTAGAVGIAALDDAANALLARMNAIVADVGFPSGTLWDLLGAPPGILSGGQIFGSFTAFRDINRTRIKANAVEVKAGAAHAREVLDALEELTPFNAALAAGASLPSMGAPVVAWEYWDGRRWQALAVGGDVLAQTFRGDGPVTFVVPDDMSPGEVSGVTARWIRARLVSGGYGIVRVISWKDEVSGKINATPIVEHRPPTLDRVRIGYLWRSDELAPEHCLAENDFRFADHSASAGARGDAFAPFARAEDDTPSLYLGFDRPLPADAIGLYLDVAEVLGDDHGPALTWEFHDGTAWLPVRATDGTRALAVPGTVSVLWPGGRTYARFGSERAWLRARLTHDGAPRRSVVRGVFANAVWASQLQTFEQETLGSSTGEPGQAFFARNLPVLEGETLEVRELAGARAHVEEATLRVELARAGVADDDVRATRDARSGRTSELWVRWHPRENLLFAGPGERVYAIERTRGRIVFGGGANGMAPPAGRDNVRLTRYRSGGGLAGNVAAGAASQLLAGVLAEKVTNARAAEGGAESEPVARVLRRGPALVRHRRQAITAADYEALALEASPAVAVARALPTTHPSGRAAPGWVTLRIVPHGTEPRPMPSFALREQVRRFVEQRAPAAARRRVRVIPPDVLPVTVEATIAPADASEAGDALRRARESLGAFLHPLTGGPDGEGWPFGRDVWLSDVAALLEGVRGVDWVEALALSVDGVRAGERLAVPADRLVVAGTLALTLGGRAG